MRIVIDMQGAQTESRFRGIGRYTLAFAQAIVRNRGGHEIILALNGLFPDTIEPIRAAFDGLLPQQDIRVWYAPGPVREVESGNEWRRETAELIREAFLASLKPDVIHVSSLFEGFVDDAVTSIGRFDQSTPVSVSLYDLIPFLNPEQYLEPNPAYKQYYLRKADYLRQAAISLSISDFSRKESIDTLSIPRHKVFNVSTAIDGKFQPKTISEAEARTFLAKYGITRAFVLYTGGADERKNLPRLIESYATLPVGLREGHQLVFAGKIPEGDVGRLYYLAHSAGMKPDELILTGYITDEELVQFYNLCQLYVFPSWHEGFGLPALEAMACGASVIGANTSSLPEVIGLDEALFDPFDVQAIAAKMEQVLVNDRFREDLRAHGLVRAKRFSWDKTAQQAIRAFEGFFKPYQETQRDVDALLGQLMQAIHGLFGSATAESDLKELAYSIDRTLASKAPRQLFVDISELIQRDARTGVQRVTRSLLRQLLLAPPVGYVVEPVYAAEDKFGYLYAKRYLQKFRGEAISAVDDPITTRAGDVFLGLDLQHHSVIAQSEFLSNARRDGVSVYFVVYDLLPIRFPNYWPHGVSVLHHSWLYAICGFDGVMCISRAVADELKSWLKENGPHRIRPLDIKWFHLGADLDGSVPTKGLPQDASNVLAAIGSKPSFLSVGTIEPRKGQEQTLAAFDLLWNEGREINLVLVGKQGWMVDNLVKNIRNHAELGKRLFWLDGISDEYLEDVYGACTCLIAASEGEGFGLPLIEAAQHDLPILSRDIPVFREVSGDSAYYFHDGKEPGVIADAVREWLDLYSQGTYPKSDGMQWLTWKQSAAMLCEKLLTDCYRA